MYILLPPGVEPGLILYKSTVRTDTLWELINDGLPRAHHTILYGRFFK